MAYSHDAYPVHPQSSLHHLLSYHNGGISTCFFYCSYIYSHTRHIHHYVNLRHLYGNNNASSGICTKSLTLASSPLKSALIEFSLQIYAVYFRATKDVEGLGTVRGIERMSMSEHRIAESSKVSALKRQNMYMKEVIEMLIREVSLSC